MITRTAAYWIKKVRESPNLSKELKEILEAIFRDISAGRVIEEIETKQIKFDGFKDQEGGVHDTMDQEGGLY